MASCALSTLSRPNYRAVGSHAKRQQTRMRDFRFLSSLFRSSYSPAIFSVRLYFLFSRGESRAENLPKPKQVIAARRICRASTIATPKQMRDWSNIWLANETVSINGISDLCYSNRNARIGQTQATTHSFATVYLRSAFVCDALVCVNKPRRPSAVKTES